MRISLIENVQRHIAMEHSKAREATSRAMGEVTSAVIATSLVLIAVFVPVSFFPGTVGILYRQFSLTIAFAIAISAFNALTLSPALSALFLRGEEARPRQLDFLNIGPISRAFAAFIHSTDRQVIWLAKTYASSIHMALRLRYVLVVLFFAGMAGTVYMYQHVPTGFLPQEDQEFLMVVVQAPPGSSLAYTTSLADRAQGILYQNHDISSAFSVMGFSLAGGSSNAGMMFVSTTPASERRAKGHSAAEIVADLNKNFGYLMIAPGGGIVQAFQPPAVNGVGSFGGFQFMLQDTGVNTLSDMDRIAHQMVGGSRARKDLVGLYTSFSANDPQVLVTIDREKAKALSVPLSQITTTLSVFMGSGSTTSPAKLRDPERTRCTEEVSFCRNGEEAATAAARGYIAHEPARGRGDDAQQDIEKICDYHLSARCPVQFVIPVEGLEVMACQSAALAV